MNKMIRLLIMAFALFVAIPACERLDDGTTGFEPADGILSEYGELVSTSSNGYWATLWFTSDDQTIIGVKVNVSTGQINKNVIVIERR